MFRLIEVGDDVIVDGHTYPVVRVSPSRFWVDIDGASVKFTKKNGIEYGAEKTRLARPVDEVSSHMQKQQARSISIGGLPEEQFAWLMKVDSRLGPAKPIMDVIKNGWDWKRQYDRFPDDPDTGALDATLFLVRKKEA